MNDRFINQVRRETDRSAFLTPWGIRECKSMTTDAIALTFGEFAAVFWERVRAGSVKFAKQEK